MDNVSEINATKRFKDFGTTVTDPTFENGRLFMKFTSNEKCEGANKNITSINNFICDEGNQENFIHKFCAYELPYPDFFVGFSWVNQILLAKRTVSIHSTGKHQLRAV